MFEKAAEDYATKHENTKYNTLEWWSKRNTFQKGAEFGYNKGLEAGRLKWHNLRKNSKDTPLIEGRYLCILDYKRVHNMPVVLMYADDHLGNFVWVADDDAIYDGCVSKWAEIPKFEDGVKEEA